MIATTDRGSIMDVGDWLRSLGLGQYETLFRENTSTPRFSAI